MHYKTPEEVLKELSTSHLGLSNEEAKRRLSFYGPNEIEERKESLLSIFLRQYTNPLIVILIIAGIFAFFFWGTGTIALLCWGLC